MNLMCRLGRHVWQHQSDKMRMCLMCYILERLVHNEWVRV